MFDWSVIFSVRYQWSVVIDNLADRLDCIHQQRFKLRITLQWVQQSFQNSIFLLELFVSHLKIHDSFFHRLQLFNSVSLFLLRQLCTLPVSPYALTLLAVTLLVPIVRTFLEYLLHFRSIERNLISWLLLFAKVFDRLNDLELHSEQVEVKEQKLLGFFLIRNIQNSLAKFLLLDVVPVLKNKQAKSLWNLFHILFVRRWAYDVQGLRQYIVREFFVLYLFHVSRYYRFFLG